MATEVIKRDGSREPFDPEKIKSSIRAAAQGTDLSEEQTEQVVEQVAGSVIQELKERGEVATTEIRGKVLTHLDRLVPAVSNAWREYDQEQGKA